MDAEDNSSSHASDFSLTADFLEFFSLKSANTNSTLVSHPNSPLTNQQDNNVTNAVAATITHMSHM